MSRYKRDVGKTALVLAGGGLSGAVYEIGALRAMDDLLVDRTVNDFGKSVVELSIHVELAVSYWDHVPPDVTV